ncbi:Mitotic-spindle organizing protein 1 [Basidiobolus ranarum]|uniref:Mitotic-spindle organizing protein 1 n=1 Tax=Basidiobolus ranarum TaxID=34480 RepID=A0ABR2WZK6_9FUNG
MEDLRSRDMRETFEIVNDISRLLGTGLDRETLSLCMTLLENGVNPDALAAVIKELRREGKKLQASEE